MNAARNILVPPEWAPQSALWVGWPHLQAEWGEAFDGARAEIGDFVRQALGFAPVRLACGSEEAEGSARAILGTLAGLTYARIATGDIWLRDTGPIMGVRGGAPEALCFGFNGWGGKFIMPGDTQTASAIAAYEGAAIRNHDFVLEGGAVEMDGAGRLLTVRQCLLNPNRNQWRERDAEAALREAFNVDNIIWLEHGLEGDHTDGHVDNIARFIGPGKVLCQRASGDDDPHAARYMEIESALRAAGLEVLTLASPGRIPGPGGVPLPASHLNYTLINGALLMPAYEARHSAGALMRLAEIFPHYEIISLPARSILEGGGSFHCMSVQIPMRKRTGDDP